MKKAKRPVTEDVGRERTIATRPTMEIQNWIWEWGQQESGRTNPASWLRDIFSEWVADYMNRKVQKNDTARKPSVPDDEDHDSGDLGTIFTARRRGMCQYCRKSFDAGDDIVARNKKYYHVECNDELMMMD